MRVAVTSDVIDAGPGGRQAGGGVGATPARSLGSDHATFAIAHVRQARMGLGIFEYLHRIDATLKPFGG